MQPMEAQLTVETGPAMSAVFVAREGDQAVLGAGPGAHHVLPGVAPRHLGIVI